MMVPIVNAVMDELNDKSVDTNIETRKDTYEKTNKVPNRAAGQSDNQRNVKAMIYLSMHMLQIQGAPARLQVLGRTWC